MYSDFFLNSYDLSIFLLRQRKHLDLPMKSVALDLGVSISTLSRIENNKFTITNDLFDSLLDIYNISLVEFKQANKEYEQLLYSILDIVCFGVNNDFDLITDLDNLDKKYKNISIPTSLVIRFIVYSVYFSYHMLDRDKIEDMNELSKYLFSNLEFFSLKVQKLLFIFLGEINFFQKKYSLALNNLNKAKDEFNSLEKYDVLLYSSLLKTVSKVGDSLAFYEYNLKFTDLCIRYGFNNRLIIGKINYGLFLCGIGQYRLALENDLATYNQFLQGNYNLNFKNVLLFNIGVDYKYIREYEKASLYIEQCIDYWNDYEGYFELSYCLYKCHKYKASKIYIEKAKRLTEQQNIYFYFINWLESILDESIELAEEELLAIYVKEFTTASITTKRMILTFLSEQYVLMNNYELAYKYSDQLNML